MFGDISQAIFSEEGCGFDKVNFDPRICQIKRSLETNGVAANDEYVFVHGNFPLRRLMGLTAEHADKVPHRGRSRRII
jgi:hypothetical protein